jgi:hypothetical protein
MRSKLISSEWVRSFISRSPNAEAKIFRLVCRVTLFFSNFLKVFVVFDCLLEAYFSHYEPNFCSQTALS